MIRPWVESYRSAGWAPVRIPPLSKAPRENDWPTVDYPPEAFAAEDNVGIKLGEPSRGLVDVDLDCDEAVDLAPRFLPGPTLTFGRGGQARHHLYVCPGARTRKPSRTHVELRSTGLQTVFPPSLHPSGAQLEFYGTGAPPLVIDEATLGDAFSRLCAATIVARQWPKLAGDKHHAALALAGALWSDGWTCDDAMTLLLPAMELDGAGPQPHREDAIRATFDPGNDRQRFGWPTVVELFGPLEGPALRRALARPAAGNAARPENERPLTDAGNAERFVDDHGHDLRHAHGIGWLRWDDVRWAMLPTEPVDLAIASARALQTRGEAAKLPAVTRWGVGSEANGRLTSTLSIASKLPSIVVTADELDTDPWALCCANGIVDLRTGLVAPHDPAQLITKCTGVAYNPAATAPRFVSFLGEIFRSDWQLAAYVMRFLGYCLTGTTREQILHVWFGHGANGKSTLIDSVSHALGDYAQTIASSLLLERRNERDSASASPDVARLRGVRLASGVETKDGQRLNESLVKQLTGGRDRIVARHLYAEPIEFVPAAKLILAVNHKPVVRGTDHGMWRRIHLIPFDARFEGDRQDRELPERLAAEAPGILALLVSQCLEWQRTGLRPPPEVLSQVAEYRDNQDVVGAFLVECCRIADDIKQPVAMSRLYQAYKSWATQSGEFCMGKHRWNSELKERGYTSRRADTERWQRIELLQQGMI